MDTSSSSSVGSEEGSKIVICCLHAKPNEMNLPRVVVAQGGDYTWGSESCESDTPRRTASICESVERMVDNSRMTSWLEAPKIR